MDRPALQKLLQRVRDRKVDVIVVYKVDRLTRALSDFAKLIELFDAHDVSFVSVTQQFNTTTSMGRLTLNVLLSFAQFEREVTAERIRDKIAASKKKGIWIGGPVPIGYTVKNKKIVVVKQEAEQVREIFRRYMALGSVYLLQKDLQDRGIVSKRRKLSSGRMIGGHPYYVAGLCHLLKNRMYIGDINYKDKSYPSTHQPIIDRKLFDAVQEQIKNNVHEHKRSRMASESLLIGKLFDDAGNRMSPVTTQKHSIRYRYYVSVPVRRGVSRKAGSVHRVPAHDAEQLVINALCAECKIPSMEHTHDADAALINRCLNRAVVNKSGLTLEITVDERNPSDMKQVVVPNQWPAIVRGRQAISSEEMFSSVSVMRPSKRRRLIIAIAKARAWYDELASGSVKSIQEIADREKLSDRHVRMLLPLAFVSPAIVTAAVNDTLSPKVGLSQLAKNVPIVWPPNRN